MRITSCSWPALPAAQHCPSSQVLLLCHKTHTLDADLAAAGAWPRAWGLWISTTPHQSSQH